MKPEILKEITPSLVGKWVKPKIGGKPLLVAGVIKVDELNPGDWHYEEWKIFDDAGDFLIFATPKDYEIQKLSYLECADSREDFNLIGSGY